MWFPFPPARSVFACWLLFSTAVYAQEKQPPLDPIPQAPGAFLEKDFRAQERAWAERCLLKPAQKGWEGKAWAAEATALVSETLALLELENSVGANLATFAPRFRKLLEASGNDPLIGWLGARALKDERLNWRDAQPVLDRVLKNGGTLSGALECHAMQMELSQIYLQGRLCEEENQRLMEALIRAINDDSYDAEAEAVFVRHQIQFLDQVDTSDPEVLLRWQEQIRQSRWPEWVKLTLEGIGETELAWMKRSDGWADTVKDAQWRGFAEHLKVARDLLAKAARLRPDRPEPASAMITVALGESVDLTELRDWFDRSVSAQFDYMPAYRNLLWAYRPRWLGSHRLMIAFGKACGETKRYDTAVPSRLMIACFDVISEVGDSRGVFRHAAVKDDIIAMSEGYLKAAPDAPPQTRHMRMSNAAICAWLADADALAAQALTEMKVPLHPAAVTYLNGLLMHEDMMRAEIAADTGAFGAAVKAAANPPKVVTREGVEQAYLKLNDKDLSPEALAYVREGRELLAFDKALATGEWVPLKTHPGLTNYYQDGGDWAVEADGTLVANGTDTKWAKILWRIPTQEDVEVRADVSFEIPAGEIAKNGYGIGQLLRWIPDGVGQVNGAARCMMFHEYSGREIAHVYNSKSDQGTAKLSVKFAPVNHLLASVSDKKISFEVNGRRVADKVPQTKIGLENERGCIGFAAFNLPWGSKARIRDIAVRKVTGKAKAPAAVVKSRKDNKLYWQLGLFLVVIGIAYWGNRSVKSREV